MQTKEDKLRFLASVENCAREARRRLDVALTRQLYRTGEKEDENVSRAQSKLRDIEELEARLKQELRGPESESVEEPIEEPVESLAENFACMELTRPGSRSTKSLEKTFGDIKLT